MAKGPQDIEFPIVELQHCSTNDHCHALQDNRKMPFWWYQDFGLFRNNYSLPFKGNLGYWWYQVRPGFAWPVDALEPMPYIDHRILRVRNSYLGYQHIVPEKDPTNSTLVINTIMDLPGYGTHAIDDKRRNAIRKGFRSCEVFALRSVEERWLDGAVQAWNDLVDRTGWKHHRDAGMLRESWAQLLQQPAATILLAVDRATNQLAGFLITKIYGNTAYVDTIASNTELLKSNPNDVLMYTFIRNAQQIPEIKRLHFAIRSDAEHLEKFKTSLGCEPHPYPAWLHARPIMMSTLRIFNPKLYTRLTAKPARGDEKQPGEIPAEAAPPAPTEKTPIAPAKTDPRWKQAAAIESLWYVAPSPRRKMGWVIYSREFVLAAMQGAIAEPHVLRRTKPWLAMAAVVWSLIVVGQSVLFAFAWTPILSSLFETVARIFGRNALGFFLRSCYWKARLQHLGQDTIIDQGVDIWGPSNVFIGSNCHIDTGVRLAAGERRHRQHGAITIGDFVHLGPNVHIAGRGEVTIGDFVGIMAGSHLYSATSAIELPQDPGQLLSLSHMAPFDRQSVREAPIRIGDYALIGMMTRIMPGVTIGKGAMIHGNMEITRNIPPFANIGGDPPGRQIGWRRPRRLSPKLQPSPNPVTAADPSQSSSPSPPAAP